MAHAIDLSNSRANIAYAGATPWHKLGFKIDADASVEEWRKAAGLDWTIKKGTMLMQTEEGQTFNASSLNRSILYRSDTQAPLSVMSTDKFHIVQPDQILSFIGDSVKAMGWKMETAGSLNGGRKVWALANLGAEDMVGTGDKVRGYLLAATACDGSMASEFMFTTVRVVCQNTLGMAMDAKNNQPRVKVYHFTKLDVSEVKKSLGIAESVWGAFMQRAKLLATIKLSETAAVQVLRKVYEKAPEEKLIAGEVVTDEQFLRENMTARKVLELYQGKAIGADLQTARGTAWGLVNATTEYYDHASKTRSADNRLNSAWFGTGAQVKQDVVDACLEMA